MDMTTMTIPQKVKFGPRRIGHANLFVGDLERSIEFYRDICGFELVFREPHLTMGFLSNGNTHHDLGLVQKTQRQLTGLDGHVQVMAGRGSKPGLNHFGWEMETEQLLVEAFERAREEKLSITRMSDHQISHSIYICDPDDNMHEFYADQMKDWRQLFNGTSGPAITGAWNPKSRAPTTDTRYPVTYELARVPNALVHPVCFSHAVLVTPNWERMLAFFSNVAGLTIVRSEKDKFACFQGTRSSTAFDIALFHDTNEKGVHHFSFLLAKESDFDDALRGLEKDGIPIEKKIDDESKRSLFIRDPDGMRCEFYWPRDGRRYRAIKPTPFHA